MATATFNTKIESLGDDSNEYDLSTVLDLSGFGDKVSYKVLSGETITISDTLMYVPANSYGVIGIGVSDEVNNAKAITTITGFYAKRAEIVGGKEYGDIYSKTLRDNWTTIINDKVR